MGTTVWTKWIGSGAALVAMLVMGTATGVAQMPDMRSMSGTPLPTSDLPVGSVAVRVVRETIANNLAGQTVELTAAGQTQRQTTDADGRATFAGLLPGVAVSLHADVDGEHLHAQEFTVPPEGGVRVMLVAGLGGAAAAADPAAPNAATAAPAQPGTVVLGGQSRIIIELNDASLDIYNLFEIVNPSNAPVATEPLVFELPEGARGATLFEGAPPQARAEGSRIVVPGPFPPGTTALPMAYQLPYTTGLVEFSQVLPADVPALVVLVNNTSGARFASPLVGDTRAVTIDGKPFISGRGGRVAAGTPIPFAIDGLPYHSQVGRYLALGLVVLVLGVGAWLAVNGESNSLSADRARATKKRDKLLRELAELERQRHTSLDPRIDVKREALVSQLEKVYRQLDHLGGADNAVQDLSASGLAPSNR
ncbi:MAG: hypothetical protein JNM38_11445 [Acidobacteria bacterium]|nr:hypothetical protein [Acidobacteriota bacterium]